METARRILCSLLKLIQKVYPSIQLYFTAEGDDWDFYLTNDVNGKYFSARYVVNMEDEVEYFDTIDEVANHLRPLFGKVVKTREEMYDAIEDWEKNNDDDQYLYIKEYSLCQLDELTDLYGDLY